MSVRKHLKSQTSLVLLLAFLLVSIYPSSGQLLSANHQKSFSIHSTNLSIVSAQEVEEEEVEKSIQDDQPLYDSLNPQLCAFEVSYSQNSLRQVDSPFFHYLFSNISTQAP